MDYQAVYTGAHAEITEKKSRFIGQVFPVSSEEEVLECIEKVKKQYWDARHHCFAYTIGEEQLKERFSDDGEPQGTAGKPILEVIRGKDLHNTLVVVTRYFGGTLLGTGGLVRAYTQASQEALASSNIITVISGFKLQIVTDYTGLGKIQYLLGQKGIRLYDTEYAEDVTLTVLIAQKEEEQLKKAITEVTNGQAEIRRVSACRFAEVNQEQKLF